jgi:subtilisin
MGPQIVLTGPGVGVVSTLPDSTYGTISGTSMACPAVTGFAAHLLSSSSEISRTADSERSRNLKDVLCGNARSFNFGRDYEGYGLPCQK